MLTLNLYFSAKLKKGFDIFMKIEKKSSFYYDVSSWAKITVIYSNIYP